jgi:hypothetical protein
VLESQWSVDQTSNIPKIWQSLINWTSLEAFCCLRHNVGNISVYFMRRPVSALYKPAYQETVQSSKFGGCSPLTFPFLSPPSPSLPSFSLSSPLFLSPSFSYCLFRSWRALASLKNFFEVQMVVGEFYCILNTKIITLRHKVSSFIITDFVFIV